MLGRICGRLVVGAVVVLLLCCSKVTVADPPAPTDIAALQQENETLRLTIKIQQKKIEALSKEVEALKARTPDEVKASFVEKQNQEVDAEATKLVDKKSLQRQQFFIDQAMEDGCLCRMSVVKGYHAVVAGKTAVAQPTFGIERFFLYGRTSKTAVDETMCCENLYWAGSYTYTTVEGAPSTVNCYSLDKQDAIKRVRALPVDKAPGG